jgi:murein DD-endopeptidase MepM/ murein hydrolase activator NlpD
VRAIRRLALVALGGALLGGALLAAPAAAQPHLSVSPAHPLPGAVVTLTLRDSGERRDSIVAIRGTMAGEPLHFLAVGREHRAIGAIPVDSVASIAAHALVTRASGRVDTLTLAVQVPPLPPPSEQLAVAPRFGRPLDAATQARVVRENARALAVGRRAHESARAWSAPFQRPRSSEVSSGFGTGRTFNGAVASRHLGVDFRGAVGAPVLAANAGVVALVDRFFLGGRVVYIDHGAGVVTGYLHLSKVLVSPGERVARGQQIGLVGATGRVTGPHLHWTARYGALTVNPLDLVALDW